MEDDMAQRASRRGGGRIRVRFAGLTAAALLLLVSPQVSAQQGEYQLFDRFSFAVEGSWAILDNVIRLDSDALGRGTELDFENDGGLDDSTIVPSLSFEWMMGRRHRLNGWWVDVDRDSINTILEEIRFGDEVFPIDEEVRFLFESEEFALGYTYYLSRSPRHAFGLGGGFRTLRVTVGLAARDLEITEEGDFTAPLPYLLLEYRYAIAPNWRLTSDLGVFYIEIGDFTGSQIVLDAWVEYLASRRFSVGGGLRSGRVDADMTTGTEIAGDFTGSVKMSIASGRVFVRLRF
jgi:hypothetical protein